MNRSRDLDHQATDTDHAAVSLDLVQFRDLFRQGLHRFLAFMDSWLSGIPGLHESWVFTHLSPLIDIGLNFGDQRFHQSRDFASFFNSSFTRFVNDCLTVLGTDASRLPGRWS